MNELILLSKIIILGPKYPRNVEFYFENKIAGVQVQQQYGPFRATEMTGVSFHYELLEAGLGLDARSWGRGKQDTFHRAPKISFITETVARRAQNGCAAVMLFQQISCSVTLKKIRFYYTRETFAGSTYPEHMLFNFENNNYWCAETCTVTAPSEEVLCIHQSKT